MRLSFGPEFICANKAAQDIRVRNDVLEPRNRRRVCVLALLGRCMCVMQSKVCFQLAIGVATSGAGLILIGW